ncbi:MAG: DUF1995 family protein [Gloeobacterales cyanobacterium]
MSELPNTYTDALEDCVRGIQQASLAGKFRQEIVFRSPGLDILEVVRYVAERLAEGSERPPLVLYPDAGAAALACQRLGEVSYPIQSINQRIADFEAYGAVLLVEISMVEVEALEKLADACGARPYIILNSRLGEAGAVGIGLVGRQLRSRFLSTLEPVFYLQPVEGGALYRSYPSNWQVWKENAPEAEGYSLVSERGTRPTAEELSGDLYRAADRQNFLKTAWQAGNRLLKALGR